VSNCRLTSQWSGRLRAARVCAAHRHVRPRIFVSTTPESQLITKLYLYHIHFAAGVTSVVENPQTLQLVAQRASIAVEHRISIEATHAASLASDDNRVDERLDLVKKRLTECGVEAARIEVEPTRRVIEVIPEDSYAERVAIKLFPRIRSLGNEGPELLGFDEVALLEATRNFGLFHHGDENGYRRARLSSLSSTEMTRITGYETLDDWLRNCDPSCLHVPNRIWPLTLGDL
jgi:hypothetical protein